MNRRIWLNVAQAAEHTGFNPQTVRRAAEAAELHGFQRTAGGHWRFHVDCLDAWIQRMPCEHLADTG